MEGLIQKIDELKKEAERVKKTCRCDKNNEVQTQTPASKRTRRNSGVQKIGNGSGSHPEPAPAPAKVDLTPYDEGDWIPALKAHAEPWTGPPLVVLSLFDGLGGIWQALTNLGIPFSGYSSEVLVTAIHVVKARHPTVKHVGDIRKLDVSAIPEKVDLVVGGFPCQDLTVMGKKEGLHGSRSKLFFDLLRVLQTFKPKWFLVENVASMSWVDRDEISRHLKLQPLELDSQEITPSKRRRLYWTNIPHPPRLPRLRDHPSTSMQSCLEDALAPEQKCGVVLCSNMYKGSNVRLELVLDKNTKIPRYMKPTEVEVLMGYPRNYTNVVVREFRKQVAKTPPIKATESKPSPVQVRTSTRELRTSRTSREFYEPDPWETKVTVQDGIKDHDRWYLLGNTFSVKVIAYLTSPLLQRSVRSKAKPVNFTGTVKEEDLSAMEPGDVWSLFNQHGRPNWYAVIKSRTGDRFSPCSHASRNRNVTRLPLKIEMQYLEMTPAYLKGELDEWNPRRGAGLLKLRDEVDMQDSWLAFSQRVTSFTSAENSYFIYPGSNEVWAIYNPNTMSRYFVYVVESTVSNNPHADKPGKEGFSARCCLLQKTTEHGIFRKSSSEVEFKDMQPFEFQVPFYLKHEADMLKVEVSGVKSRKSMGVDRETCTGYRGKGKKGDSDDDDEDDTDDLLDDVIDEDDVVEDADVAAEAVDVDDTEAVDVDDTEAVDVDDTEAVDDVVDENMLAVQEVIEAIAKGLEDGSNGS